MQVVVTGGAGFVGSQLGKSLADDGHDVTLLDNMSFGYLDNLVIDGKTFGRFVGADIRDADLVRRFAGAEVVFHLAGISALPVCQERPQECMAVNAGGTANVLEAARRAGVRRVVFSSTSAMYENTKTFPTPENDITTPTLLYSVSKWQAEALCHTYREAYGIEVVVLRYFNVYGPHQDFKRTSPPLMSYVIRELLHGRQPVLHSDGTQRRDCVYVDDVNRLNKLVMTHPAANGETFNVASGVATSVRDIYASLAKALKSDIAPIYQPSSRFWDTYPGLFNGKHPFDKSLLEKEVRKYTLGDTSKAKRLLGWTAEVSIEEGLHRTALYAQERL